MREDKAEKQLMDLCDQRKMKMRRIHKMETGKRRRKRMMRRRRGTKPMHNKKRERDNKERKCK